MPEMIVVGTRRQLSRRIEKLETIATMVDALVQDRGQNATFWIRETNDGAYQIMVEPNSLAPMLRIGSPFEMPEEAQSWIDNESASWFEKFRRGI